MKVIFISDVPNVARIGQTKVVADGYARNYLFPRKLAVLADSPAAASVDARLKKLLKQRAVEEAEMAELAKKIGGLEITLEAKVGEHEKLYGSITGADIAEALSRAAGCVIDKKLIALAEPIKQAGLCDVVVRFTHDIQAVIKVDVVAEGAEEKAEKAEEKAEAKKEKAEKKEKKAPKEEKKEELAAGQEEKPAGAEKAEKPAKEKKAKAEKPAKEEKAAKAEEKKEKKSKAKKEAEAAE